MKKRRIKIPERAVGLLAQIPQEFKDDGCSNAPDSLFGYDFRWACRIHNWRYCSRCHTPRKMGSWWRTQADLELRLFVRQALPWRWRWVGWIYRFFVWRYGGISAFDSCGPEVGLLCRHNMPYPEWMRQPEGGPL